MIYCIGCEDLFEDGYTKTSMESLLLWLKDRTVIAVDTETEGMFDFENRVIMLQIGDGDNQFVIDTRSTDVSMLKEIFESDKILKLFWNAKFDMKFLRYTFGWKTVNVYDGFLVACILTTGLITKELGLEAAVRTYCGVQLDKEERSKFVDLKGRGFTQRQIKYGSEDVAYLHKVKEEQEKLVAKYELENTVKLENKFVEVLYDVEYRGFKLDVSKWKALSNNNKEAHLKAMKIMEDYVLSRSALHAFHDRQLDLFDSTAKTTIEWSSPSQVARLLQILGIDTKAVDKKSGQLRDSVEAKHLKKFEKQFDIIPIYLDYKEKEKLVSTYGDAFLKFVNRRTGRIHSDFWQILETSRISSNRPNMQNIPSDEETRACFVSQDAHSLVIGDFSSQEPRITADKCQDSSLIEFFLNGDGDMHSLVSTKMYTVINKKETIVTKDNENKALRQIGKILGLKIDYGGSAWTVKDDLGVSQEEAQKFIDAYFEGFPGKKKYFKECIAQVWRDGYIFLNPVTRRRSWCDNFETIKEASKNYDRLSKEERSQYFKRKGSIERNAQNYPKMCGVVKSL